MHRLFLDANVLFSAAYRPDAGLLSLWKLKTVALCSSRYAVEEARINLDDDEQRGRLTTLIQHLQLFDAASQDLPSGVSLPEKDVPILLAAIEAHKSPGSEANKVIDGFNRLNARERQDIVNFLRSL